MSPELKERVSFAAEYYAPLEAEKAAFTAGAEFFFRTLVKHPDFAEEINGLVYKKLRNKVLFLRNENEQLTLKLAEQDCGLTALRYKKENIDE